MRMKIISGAIAILMLAQSLHADDWRSELRAKMKPDESVVDVMAARGTFFADWIGDHFVEMSWNGDLLIDVDNNSVTDVAKWEVDEGSLVVAFSAYPGRGVLGPNGNSGLVGWLYMDDTNELRVEMEVNANFAVYEVTSQGTISAARAKVCRRRNVGGGTCTNTNCDNTENCAGDINHYCEWAYGLLADFAAEFDIVLQD